MKPNKVGGQKAAVLVWSVAAAVAVVFRCPPAVAGETDQYLSWGVELRDSTAVFNRYLNERAAFFLEKANGRPNRFDSCEGLVEKFYLHLFRGLHSARIRSWLQGSEEIDRWPPPEVGYFEHMRVSIYRNHTFPFFLPMARTMRLGDTYLGIDKVSHFFGFGRRYFEKYRRLRRRGLGEEEAEIKVVRFGIFQEQSVVGKLVDSIFSRGDMEANYQGMRMAIDLCDGDDPYFKKEDGQWRLCRPLDITPYITPDFDESYNNSHYRGLRRRNVSRILKGEYCGKIDDPMVLARFERYRSYEPSLSQRVIAEYFERKGEDPQKRQSIHTLCASSN